VLQYRLRRAVLSRVLLFGIPALLILCMPISARLERQHTRDRIEANYPATPTPPVQLVYRPIDPDLGQIDVFPDNSDVIIHTPLDGTGVAPGTVLIPDAVKLEAEAPNGFHWASDWQDTNAPKFYAGAEGSYAAVAMPRAIYEQLKATPLTIHVTFALTQAKATSVSQVALPRHDFSVSGFGACAPLTGSYSPFFGATGLICRSVLRDPPLTYINVAWSDSPCNVPQSDADPGVQGAGWAGSLDRAIADPNISPVQQVNFNLTNGFKSGGHGGSRFLCPGSRVIFTQYERAGRTEAGVTIHDFHLPILTTHEYSGSVTSSSTGQNQ
jgi:hypothetical protein